jgi:hypothetical protein
VRDAAGAGDRAAEGDRGKALPPPARTLTFIWGDENRGSRAWLTAHPDQAKGVQYMFSMDMTGEDTAKTGGTFLIEKQADPSPCGRVPRIRTRRGARAESRRPS